MKQSSLSRAVSRLKSFLSHDIWERDLADIGRLKAFIFYQLRVIFLVMRGFTKDRCGLRAAGLAYITLLTLIPLLALVFSIGHQVGGLNSITEKYLKPYVYSFLTFDRGIGLGPMPGEEEPGEETPDETGPEEDTPDPRGEGESDGPPEREAGEEGSSTPPDRESPDDDARVSPPPGGEEEQAAGGTVDVEAKKREISEKIDEFISNIQTGKLGGIAALFTLLATVALLSHIEGSFNDIWGVKRSRTLFKRITVYWTVITFGPVLLTVSLALTASFQNSSFVGWILERVPFSREVMSMMIPLVFSWGAFTLLYQFMPNTGVRFSSALWGGVLGGTLWEAAKWGSTVYFAQAIKWDSMFGPLGVIPIFLIWIYFSWVIVLFGAELAFAHQNARTYRKEEASLSASPHFREIVCLGIVTRIGRHHSGGFVPPSASDLAEEMGVPVRLVQDLLFLLSKYGIVMEASGTEKSPGYVPSRPLEQIRTQEVVDIVRHHSPMPLTLPSGEETGAVLHLVEEADRARIAVFQPVTVAELLSERFPGGQAEVADPEGGADPSNPAAGEWQSQEEQPSYEEDQDLSDSAPEESQQYDDDASVTGETPQGDGMPPDDATPPPGDLPRADVPPPHEGGGAPEEDPAGASPMEGWGDEESAEGQSPQKPSE